jgi:hypothetical protein
MMPTLFQEVAGNIDLVHFSHIFYDEYSVIADPPAMLAGILPSHRRERGACLSCIDKPCALRRGGHRLDRILRQAFDGYARSTRGLDTSHGTECGGTMVFQPKIPLKVAGGRIELDLLMQKSCFYV